MDLVFLDLETTGLDPARHTLFEVAMIKGELRYVWWIPPTDVELAKAESMALKVNNFYNRQTPSTGGLLGPSVQLVLESAWKVGQYEGKREAISRNDAALEMAKLTNGCLLAGNNVKFDQQFLERWMRKNGAAPTWDYHVLDVPTVAGAVALERQGKLKNNQILDLPFKSSKVSKWFNVDEPEGFDAHTALADAEWSLTIWKAITQVDWKP